MDLPEAIIFNILLRLSVPLLLRFKCVCKLWCVLIDSTHFKDNYLALRRAKALDDQLVCLKLIRYEYGIFTSFLTGWYEDCEPLSALDAASAPSSNGLVEILSRSRCPGQCFITGHSNGIVCVQGGNRGRHWEQNIRENWFDVTLVNPALREFRKLPVPDLGGEDYECFVDNIGFGYDDATNDYKVFVVVSVANLGYRNIGLVYRLSTDSWRVLGNMSDFVFHNYFTPDGELSMSGDTLFAHGSIHCIMWLDPYCRILAFNLTTESFQEILYPHGWRLSYDEKTIGSHLLTFDKSTIGLAALTKKEERLLDIWVMKEYGDPESWTKLYSISSFPSFRSLISFWRKDKLLLKRIDSRLICYDIITGQQLQYELGGSYGLSEGQDEDEPPGHLDPICGQPLNWYLQFFTGHESFVSLKQV